MEGGGVEGEGAEGEGEGEGKEREREGGRELSVFYLQLASLRLPKFQISDPVHGKKGIQVRNRQKISKCFCAFCHNGTAVQNMYVSGNFMNM